MLNVYPQLGLIYTSDKKSLDARSSGSCPSWNWIRRPREDNSLILVTIGNECHFSNSASLKELVHSIGRLIILGPDAGDGRPTP